MYSNINQSQPTVVEAAEFDPSTDADKLRTATQGDLDNETIINIITGRTNHQRQDIVLAFKQKYGVEFIEVFKSKLATWDITKKDYKNVIVALIQPSDTFLCKELKRGLEDRNTKILTELLCSRTRKDIDKLFNSYLKHYNCEPLAKIYKSHYEDLTQLQQLLVLIEKRKEEADLDLQRAEMTLQTLTDVVKCKDYEIFTEILTRENFTQLQYILKEFSNRIGRTIEQIIKDLSLENDLNDALLAIVGCVQNRAAWFATRLYKSMKGLGTDDDTLVRIVVTRSEIDLKTIKLEYERLYNKTLESAIRGDTSGYYLKTLMALIGVRSS